MTRQRDTFCFHCTKLPKNTACCAKDMYVVLALSELLEYSTSAYDCLRSYFE